MFVFFCHLRVLWILARTLPAFLESVKTYFSLCWQCFVSFKIECGLTIRFWMLVWWWLSSEPHTQILTPGLQRLECLSSNVLLWNQNPSHSMGPKFPSWVRPFPLPTSLLMNISGKRNCLFNCSAAFQSQVGVFKLGGGSRDSNEGEFMDAAAALKEQSFF